MGVSIHYRGALQEPLQVFALCEDLEDVAASMGWDCTKLNEDWTRPNTAQLEHNETGPEITGHLPLKGVSLNVHPECESVSFFFDSEGKLQDVMTMMMVRDGAIDPEHAYVHVKTQFASPETHITIVKLLRYLKKKYIPDLEVMDEGEYWETGDQENLYKKMQFIADKIDMVANALSESDLIDASEMTDEEVAEKIEKVLKEKLGTGNQPEK